MKSRPATALPLERAAAFVRQRTGLVFPATRKDALAEGIARAMDRARVRDLDTYLGRVDRDPSLLDDLVAEITVGETYFFREPEQFTLIEQDILPGFQRRHPGGTMRIWSAGCASGEEAYSLAAIAGHFPVRILATDVSRPALAKARRGTYGRWSLRGVPNDAIDRHFVRQGEQVDVKPELRRKVEFRYLNLAEDVFPSTACGVWGMDLILCRNVLIYFDAETVARVVRRLLDSLADDGWLLLGALDPAIWQLVPCHVVLTSSGVAYRKSRHTDRPFTPETARPVDPDPSPDLAPPPLEAHLPVQTPQRALAPDNAATRYAAGDYGAAAALAADSVRLHPEREDQWVLLVRALANAGQLNEAARHCVTALEAHHRMSAELTYLHATLLIEAGLPGEAATAARRALYLDRSLAVAHLALGWAMLRTGNRREARQAFRNASRVLDAMPADALVPSADGEPAGRLAAIARAHDALLNEDAA